MSPFGNCFPEDMYYNRHRICLSCLYCQPFYSFFLFSFPIFWDTVSPTHIFFHQLLSFIFFMLLSLNATRFTPSSVGATARYCQKYLQYLAHSIFTHLLRCRPSHSYLLSFIIYKKILFHTTLQPSSIPYTFIIFIWYYCDVFLMFIDLLRPTDLFRL